MLFYISFLRPPLASSSLASPVSFTPQIANDLRTDLFHGQQDLFYSWNHGRPVKLTTWRQSNAYKEISVPPPAGVRDGQSYRLILTANLIPYVDLANLNSVPLPVMSVPILFTSKPGTKTKQEQIERMYRFPIHDKTLVSMKITEQTSFDLDKKIWDSGIGLSSWLSNLPNLTDPLLNRLKDALFSTEPRNIVELGAGTGIVAITIGALRAGILGSISESESNSSRDGEDENNSNIEGGSIFTTDLPSAIPLLQHNISSNAHLFRRPSPSSPQTNSSPSPSTSDLKPLPGCTPTPLVLDWDSAPDLPPEITEPKTSSRTKLDLIVMADVTYNTSSFPSLVRTIRSLVARTCKLPEFSSSKDAGEEHWYPTILVGYKQRDPGERELFGMLEEAFSSTSSGAVKIKLTKVGEVPGASSKLESGEGRGPVEIWLGEVVALT